MKMIDRWQKLKETNQKVTETLEARCKKKRQCTMSGGRVEKDWLANFFSPRPPGGQNCHRHPTSGTLRTRSDALGSMASGSVVSLLKLLQSQIINDPSRWTAAWKNLISRQKGPKAQELLPPARWNGVTYGALLSQWRSQGLVQRADALDIALERLSQCVFKCPSRPHRKLTLFLRFASTNFPTEEILRLLLLLADVQVRSTISLVPPLTLPLARCRLVPSK